MFNDKVSWAASHRCITTSYCKSTQHLKLSSHLLVHAFSISDTFSSSIIGQIKRYVRMLHSTRIGRISARSIINKSVKTDSIKVLINFSEQNNTLCLTTSETLVLLVQFSTKFQVIVRTKIDLERSFTVFRSLPVFKKTSDYKNP